MLSSVYLSIVTFAGSYVLPGVSIYLFTCLFVCLFSDWVFLKFLPELWIIIKKTSFQSISLCMYVYICMYTPIII